MRKGTVVGLLVAAGLIGAFAYGATRTKTISYEAAPELKPRQAVPQDWRNNAYREIYHLQGVGGTF